METAQRVFKRAWESVALMPTICQRNAVRMRSHARKNQTRSAMMIFERVKQAEKDAEQRLLPEFNSVEEMFKLFDIWSLFTRNDFSATLRRLKAHSWCRKFGDLLKSSAGIRFKHHCPAKNYPALGICIRSVLTSKTDWCTLIKSNTIEFTHRRRSL